MAGYCPSSCLWVFVDWDKVKVHKQAKKKEKKKTEKNEATLCIHPSLTKQVWSRQDGEKFFRQDAARNPEIFG